MSDRNDDLALVDGEPSPSRADFPAYRSFHAHHCVICKRPLTVHEQAVGQSCSQSECRDRLLRSELQTRLEQEAELRRLACDWREAVARIERIDPPEQLGIAILPSNDRPLTNLPAQRIEGFRQRLKGIIAQAFACQEADTDDADDTEEETQQDFAAETAERLAAGCATCRGHCCPQGGDHAFVTVETIQRYRREHPEQGPEDVLQAYVSRLGNKTYDGSCVYHAEHGCRLPREMRAQLCNQYLCKGLKEFLCQFPEPHDGPSLMVATAEFQVVRSAIIEADDIRVYDRSSIMIDRGAEADGAIDGQPSQVNCGQEELG